jgi:hypothetical protein
MAMWSARFEFFSWSLAFEHVFTDQDVDTANSASCRVAPWMGFRRFGIRTAFRLSFVSRVANRVPSQMVSQGSARPDSRALGLGDGRKALSRKISMGRLGFFGSWEEEEVS